MIMKKNNKKKSKNKALIIIFSPFILLYKLLDKYIITPVSKFILKVYKKFKVNNSFVDKILNKQNSLIVISLIIAIVAFVVVDSKAVKMVESEAELLTGQELNVIYNEEAYVVDGIPDSVDITLIGRRSDLYLAKQLGDHKVVLDLTGYGPGEHKVKLKYNHSVETVNYKLDPSNVTVIIREKVSSVKSLSYDILNQDKIDAKLSIGKVTLDRSDVIVKGSAETLSQIATVKALVDVSVADLSSAGKYTIDSIPLVAYNESGSIIKNVEIVPEKISAEVIVTSYNKEVPVKVTTTGNATTGYAISSISSSVNKVTIYGEQDIIDKITYIAAPIDITNLSSDKSYSVTLTKPSGVRFMSETSASVEVNVEAESSVEITVSQINFKNLGNNLSANAASLEDTSVVVIAKGVKSVLNSIDYTNIKAYVDLSGYGVGTHNVPVKIDSDDVRINYTPKVKTISIVITNNKK